MFFLPFLTVTLCSPIDGVASISIISDLASPLSSTDIMEKLDHLGYCVWLHFCVLPPSAEREKKVKPSEFFALFVFADGGNRTRADGAASEYAKHYSIAHLTPT